MESELISVIIPMYNVEPYILRCIKSILDGDYKDIEIICIDDGSTDGTVDAVKSLLNEDKRIRLFQQQNRGVSSARNYGLREARGQYVAFVDADDWVSHDYLITMLTIAADNGADIVNCGFWGVSENASKRSIASDKSCQVLQIPEKDIYREIVNHVWRALYRKDICPFFNESVRIGEDQVFNIRILSENTPVKAWKCTKQMYFHVWRSDSLFSSAGNERFAYICNAIVNEMNSLPTTKYAVIGAVRQALGYRYCVSFSSKNENDKRQANSLVRETAVLMMKCRDLSLLEKIKHLPFICSSRLYRAYRGRR